MGLLDRLLNRSVTPTEQATGVIPPARNATVSVTVDNALSLPAMYRAVQIIAVSIAQLPIGVSRSNGPVAELPALARRPNLWQTRSQFLKRTAVSLATTGNAFWRIDRDPKGAVINLTPLNPLGMTWEDDARGHRTWHHSDLITGPATYTSNQIKHLRLLEVPGHVMGIGPIQACRVALGGALDLRRYSDNWFAGAGVPTGILSTDQNLTPIEADAYRTRWHQIHAKREVAVLSKGLAYSPVVLNPEDAQWLESQSFAVTDIARMMGVPAPYLLAAVDGATFTYQNREQVDAEFARTTLLGYVMEIEDALTDLLPIGQTAKLDLTEWLRPDEKTRAEIDEIHLRAGLRTPDEIRARDGLQPLPPAALPAPATTPAEVTA